MYIALGILIIYLLYVFITYRCIPDSISDTFYLGTKWGFTALMTILSFIVAPTLLSVTSSYFTCFAFLTAVGLLFVGAAPHFKERNEKYIHFGGAFTFGISSQIWAAVTYSPWLLCSWALLPLFIKSQQRTFWIEILCVINLMLAYALPKM